MSTAPLPEVLAVMCPICGPTTGIRVNQAPPHVIYVHAPVYYIMHQGPHNTTNQVYDNSIHNHLVNDSRRYMMSTVQADTVTSVGSAMSMNTGPISGTLNQQQYGRTGSLRLSDGQLTGSYGYQRPPGQGYRQLFQNSHPGLLVVPPPPRYRRSQHQEPYTDVPARFHHGSSQHQGPGPHASFPPPRGSISRSQAVQHIDSRSMYGETSWGGLQEPRSEDGYSDHSYEEEEEEEFYPPATYLPRR